MKYCLFAFIIAAAMPAQSIAQSQAQTLPRWVPQKGYWVVESNLHEPLKHEVRFYTDEGNLVYSEIIEGVRLDIRKRSVKMRLKAVLETAISAWNRQKPIPYNADLLALALKK